MLSGIRNPLLEISDYDPNHSLSEFSILTQLYL